MHPLLKESRLETIYVLWISSVSCLIVGNIHHIPPLLQSVIDHLVYWQLLPVYKKPNSCIINIYEEALFLVSLHLLVLLRYGSIWKGAQTREHNLLVIRTVL